MDAVVRTPPPAAAAGEQPRDARVVRRMLHSMGLKEGDYDARVVYRFVELAHRYAGDVLGRALLEANDVRLAIQAKAAFAPGP